MYKVRMDKYRSTWNYFTTNPLGGGFGSNYCGPRYIALAKATYALKPGEQYELVVNGRNLGVFTVKPNIATYSKFNVGVR